MYLRDSLVLRKNYFSLDNFDDFCISYTGKYLLDYIDKNIEDYESLMQEYYKNID